MTDALDILREAFDRAAEAGTPRLVWWRDDDAVRPGPRLDALAALARDAGAPLALAAIPARTEPALLEWCRAEGVALLQHGIAHDNHEPAGKSAELGAARSVEAIVDALRAVRLALEGPSFVPVVVPPWNRMRPDLLPALLAAGWRGVSLFGGDAVPGRVDTHLDPVDWRGGRSLAAPEALAAMATRAAAVRGPIGLLTHHAVHDGTIDAFCAAFARLVADHPGARWAAAEELFP